MNTFHAKPFDTRAMLDALKHLHLPDASGANSRVEQKDVSHDVPKPKWTGYSRQLFTSDKLPMSSKEWSISAQL